MKNLKIATLSMGAIFIALLFIAVNLQAQNNKTVLDIEAAKSWRNHSATLSDDGNWYTVLYSQMEKDTANLQDSLFSSYGDEIQTDVLYVYQIKTGLQYSIPQGSNPAFSPNSEWIAYRITPKSNSNKKEKEKTLTELRNLKTGFTRQYESGARFQFPEETNLFISSDKNSLLVFDLNERREHFIGDIGSYLIDKKTEELVYTIKSADMRGNGIYSYHPAKRITQAMVTGNYLYSDLSWNADRSKLAAIRYTMNGKEPDYKNMGIVLISGIGSSRLSSENIDLRGISGLPEMMGLAVDSAGSSNNIFWSHDNERLLLKVHEYPSDEKKHPVGDQKEDEESTVSVWHWKDDKLLSEQMTEAERKKHEVFDVLLNLKTKEAIQLTDKTIQRLTRSRGTDRWAVGTDESPYLSDWDIRRNDLYRIDLKTGARNLIEKAYPGSFELSPDGEKLLLWKDGHYWCYDFKIDRQKNLTRGLDVSFINQENDHWGQQPPYGFVAWVRDQDAILLNHKLDLWLVSLDPQKEAINLTKSVTGLAPIRFRIDDVGFRSESEIPDRYLDLQGWILLNAFNTQTKHAGYYELKGHKLRKLIFEPASFGASRWGSSLVKAKHSDVILFKKGDFENYPETYLSTISFTDPKKITNSNPQQEKYYWGHRILIDYHNDDAVPLQGILSIPDSYVEGQKLPMLVYSYEKLSDGRFGYPSPSIGGARICEMMYVSDGYLVLQPDIHFNVGTPHSDMHECIDAAVRKVIELGYVDEGAIGYEGFSYGGHCGMYISTQENRFAAIAAGAGVSNLVQGFNIDIVGDGSNEQDYYMVGQGRLGTDPTGNTEMYISESAVFNAHTMNTPLLLFHGTVDNVVQWEHSFGFYSILRYLKKPVVFLSYHGEGHGLRQKANRIDIQTRLKEYFDHYLKGKEAGQWISEGVPYQPKENKKEPMGKEKARATLPKWK